MPDVVSSKCGLSENYLFCGSRSINFYDIMASKFIITWPYRAFNYDPVNSTLTVTPSKDYLGGNLIVITMSLDSPPLQLTQ